MYDIDDLLKQKKWAVVGATTNPEKFGYKIFKYMQQTGDYTLYPVNPGVSEVLGVPCVSSIKDLPEKVDVVDLVVPPKVGEQVVRECAEAGISTVWLQPGADAPPVVALAKELGLTVVTACVMAELRKRGK